jgi:rRNA maturation endonuclease Nob1
MGSKKHDVEAMVLVRCPACYTLQALPLQTVKDGEDWHCEVCGGQMSVSPLSVQQEKGEGK